MANVCFHAPRIDVDLADDDLRRVLRELSLLDRPGTPYSARGAADLLVDAQLSDGRLDLDEWPRAEVLALCRALDHLRNLDAAVGEARTGDATQSRSRAGGARPRASPLARLRDAALAYAGLPVIAYELALRVPDGEERRFRSHTGPYEPGDRCVHAGGAFTVLEVGRGGEGQRLVCEPDRR
jgi:hypothetical protein